jgi:hypothetical protein
MMTNDTSGTVVGAVGGVAAGYVLWLLAFSIADDNAAVGQSRRQLPNSCQPHAIHPQKSRIPLKYDETRDEYR